MNNIRRFLLAAGFALSAWTLSLLGQSQGDGAAALIKKRVVVSAAPMPPLPAAIVIPPDTNYATFYFSATATDTNGLESDYSNEVVYTNRYSSYSETVALAWDRSPGTNVITKYSVYYGGASRTYTNVTKAGTNLTAIVRLAPEPPTNFVLTVTATGGATNIFWASSLKGTRMALNTTNYVATNLPAPRYFWGRGKRGNQVLITGRWQ